MQLHGSLTSGRRGSPTSQCKDTGSGVLALGDDGATPGSLSNESTPEGVVGLYEMSELATLSAACASEGGGSTGNPEPPASAGGDDGGDGPGGVPGG